MNPRRKNLIRLIGYPARHCADFVRGTRCTNRFDFPTIGGVPFSNINIISSYLSWQIENNPIYEFPLILIEYDYSGLSAHLAFQKI